MEDIQQRVKYTIRGPDLYKAARELSLVELVAELVEQAYLAGWNRYTPSNGMVEIDETEFADMVDAKEPETVGVPLVMARNFVKDKGLRE